MRHNYALGLISRADLWPRPGTDVLSNVAGTCKIVAFPLSWKFSAFVFVRATYSYTSALPIAMGMCRLSVDRWPVKIQCILMRAGFFVYKNGIKLHNEWERTISGNCQAAYHLHGQTFGSGRKNAVLALLRGFQRCLGCWPNIGPSHGYYLWASMWQTLDQSKTLVRTKWTHTSSCRQRKA